MGAGVLDKKDLAESYNVISKKSKSRALPDVEHVLLSPVNAVEFQEQTIEDVLTPNSKSACTLYNTTPCNSTQRAVT